MKVISGSNLNIFLFFQRYVVLLVTCHRISKGFEAINVNSINVNSLNQTGTEAMIYHCLIVFPFCFLSSLFDFKAIISTGIFI